MRVDSRESSGGKVTVVVAGDGKVSPGVGAANVEGARVNFDKQAEQIAMLKGKRILSARNEFENEP